MNKPETPSHIIPEKDKNDSVTETLMDTILIEKLLMKTRIEQASKPLYITRYE